MRREAAQYPYRFVIETIGRKTNFLVRQAEMKFSFSFSPLMGKSFASVCRSTASISKSQNHTLQGRNTLNLDGADMLGHCVDPYSVRTCSDFEISNDAELLSTFIPQEYWDQLYEKAISALNHSSFD